jgi:hypothetical protein
VLFSAPLLYGGIAVNTLSFFARLSLAFRLFFHVLADPEFAASIPKFQKGERPTDTGPKFHVAPVPSFREARPDAALQLLGLLQQQGRFIDFLEEDVSGFSDTDVGAAARVVHQGCRKALREHFKIVPIRPEPEGSRITLPEGYDASLIRLAGNVVGKPPYNGNLVHRGWRADESAMPKVAEGHDVRVLAAAEVEL